MRKAGTLRGRGSFRILYRSGRRLDGEVMRCFFLSEQRAGTPVRAGFSVSSRMYNAVKRNRARRLMRETYGRERDLLDRAADQAGSALTLLFVYRGSTPAMPPGYEAVSRDMETLCRKVRAALEQERP